LYASAVIHTAGYNGTGNGSVIIKPIIVNRVTQIDAGEDVNLLPNPASDMLTISTGSMKYDMVIVTNCIGQVLINRAVTTTEIRLPIQELPTGVYYITLQGKSKVVKHFVKQ
jgi:Secretion system C-terminal sorting domain